ncbi:hypothetical protein ABPG75_004473 [Micractinium tetrahymenae]
MEAARQEFQHALWGGSPGDPAGQQADLAHAKALQAMAEAPGGGKEDLMESIFTVLDKASSSRSAVQRALGEANVEALLLPLLSLGSESIPAPQAVTLARLLLNFTAWDDLWLSTRLRVLKRLVASTLEGAAHLEACPCPGCYEGTTECLRLLCGLTSAERGEGLGTHASQDGVRLRLALAQQTQLLPVLSAKVAAAGEGRLELPEPYATRQHIAACALLGDFAGSINHIDVEADS